MMPHASAKTDLTDSLEKSYSCHLLPVFYIFKCSFQNFISPLSNTLNGWFYLYIDFNAFALRRSPVRVVNSQS